MSVDSCCKTWVLQDHAHDRSFLNRSRQNKYNYRRSYLSHHLCPSTNDWASNQISDGELGMSKGGKPSGNVFNFDRIRDVIKLMEQHDLSEIDLQQGDEKIKLCRGAVASTHRPSAAPAPAAPAAAPTEGPDTAGTVTINSPMVGTFYARANPESDPFVNVGSAVNEDTVVCIVEAMKVFNEIPAECRGKIVEVLVEDQQPVDFGMPMFRVQVSK